MAASSKWATKPVSAPDPQPVFLTIAQWLGGLALVGLGWLWREISAKASKEELTDSINAQKDQDAAILTRIDEHYQDAKDDFDRLYSKVDEINRTLGVTMISLSRLQGQIEEQDRRRGSS
jgi:hypothetical protein